jgi:hypothetical protein
MKKLFCLIFVLVFISTFSSVFATDNNMTEKECEFQDQMQKMALEYQESYVPMNFLPEFLSWWTAGGMGMGVVDLGLASTVIVPIIKYCAPTTKFCALVGILDGIVGGTALVAAIVGTGAIPVIRYIVVSKHNEKYGEHMDMKKLIETAFSYDDLGPIIQTSKDVDKGETQVLIENAEKDILLQMIATYHRANPTYEISAAELARRIRSAIFAGYFTPSEKLGVQDGTGKTGKWADVKINELMNHLAIAPDELKEYYDKAGNDCKNLSTYEQNIQRSKSMINSGVFDLK